MAHLLRVDFVQIAFLSFFCTLAVQPINLLTLSNPTCGIT